MLILIFNVYICIACLKAGYMYKEQIMKKEKGGFLLLLDCIIYGLFGWIFALKYYFKKYNKKCNDCEFFKIKKCIKTGRYCSKNTEACVYFEQIKRTTND